jgi:hypothetical protein
MEYSAVGTIVKHNDDTSLEALGELNTFLITVQTKTKISTPTTFKQLVCFCRNSPPMGQSLLTHEVSRSPITTHHSR